MIPFKMCELILLQNSQCRYGMVLKIRAKFILGIMPTQWLISIVNVFELDIDLGDTTTIQQGAFHSATFMQTDTLTLTNLNISNLSNTTLDGFKNLRQLNLYQLHNSVFPIGWLAPVSATLKYLIVFGDFMQSYNITGLTGGATAMRRLSVATFSLHLRTIDEFAFAALVAVQTMDLSACAIEVIGANAFRPMAQTIKLLKLNNNQIKHLTADLFVVLLQGAAQIYLAANPFDCSCALAEFQAQVHMYQKNFVSLPKCAQPYYLYDVDIDVVENCVDGVTPSLLNRFIKCYNNQSAFVYKPLQKKVQLRRMVRNANGLYKLETLHYHGEDVKVLYDNLSECIKCQSQPPGDWMQLNQMQLFLFCVMNHTQVYILFHYVENCMLWSYWLWVVCRKLCHPLIASRCLPCERQLVTFG